MWLKMAQTLKDIGTLGFDNPRHPVDIPPLCGNCLLWLVMNLLLIILQINSSLLDQIFLDGQFV